MQVAEFEKAAIERALWENNNRIQLFMEQSNIAQKTDTKMHTIKPMRNGLNNVQTNACCQYKIEPYFELCKQKGSYGYGRKN